MLGLSFSKYKVNQVGVDFMPTGVAVVDVSIDKNRHGQVRQCEFMTAVGSAEQGRVLRDWVTQKKLKQTACVSLIAKHDVQMFQMDKPPVEDGELLQAVSWKIKDLISYDLDTAVVDVFELPLSSKSPASLINAVVANESVLASYVETIKQSGLQLKVIDVHDLAVKNYTQLHDFSQQTICVLQFSNNSGMLSILQDDDLYVARDFKIGLLDIEAAKNEDESLYDSLLLELQRSMDYFESSYAIGLVQKMVIFPQTPATERMASYVQNNVAYELDFVQVEAPGKEHEKYIDPHCFGAYCAALRRT